MLESILDIEVEEELMRRRMMEERHFWTVLWKKRKKPEIEYLLEVHNNNTYHMHFLIYQIM